MSWLIVAIIAHFLMAAVFLVDKYLLSKTALSPSSYAFYVGIFGSLSILLFPFGFGMISLGDILISFLAGISFILAIFFFYKVIKIRDVSGIAPLIGAMVPIFTFIMTYLLLEDRLSQREMISFLLFVLGGLIILWPSKKDISGKGFLIFKNFILILIPTIFFSMSFVLTKLIFNNYQFINGFIWIRIGGGIGAIFMFLNPIVRKEVLRTNKKISFKAGGLAVVSKATSAFSFILLNYAIFLGSVTLVNALQGVQYAFLLTMGYLISKKYPEIIKEKINDGIIAKKVIAIILIITGLAILAI